MKKFVLGALAVSALVGSSPSMAASYLVPGDDPVTTYTVCHHRAEYIVNDQARRLRAGGETYTDNGSTVTIGRSPSVFLQTKKLVHYSYQSLSAGGDCYN